MPDLSLRDWVRHTPGARGQDLQRALPLPKACTILLLVSKSEDVLRSAAHAPRKAHGRWLRPAPALLVASGNQPSYPVKRIRLALDSSSRRKQSTAWRPLLPLLVDCHAVAPVAERRAPLRPSSLPGGLLTRNLTQCEGNVMQTCVHQIHMWRNRLPDCSPASVAISSLRNA